MTTYNTGNPVPSADARDRYDNSQTLDEVVNGDSESYATRTGKQVISLGGMNSRFNNAQAERESEYSSDKIARDTEFEADQASRSEDFEESQDHREATFAQFLDGSGWSSLGVYAAGISIVSHTQTVDYLGQPYSLKPSIPASLDAPYITTGVWATEGVNFKLVGDNSLRQDLAGDDGASKVGYKDHTVYQELDDFGSVGGGKGAEKIATQIDPSADVIDLSLKLNGHVTGEDFGLIADATTLDGLTGTDNTLALTKAINYINSRRCKLRLSAERRGGVMGYLVGDLPEIKGGGACIEGAGESCTLLISKTTLSNHFFRLKGNSAGLRDLSVLCNDPTKDPVATTGETSSALGYQPKLYNVAIKGGLNGLSNASGLELRAQDVHVTNTAGYGVHISRPDACLFNVSTDGAGTDGFRFDGHVVNTFHAHSIKSKRHGFRATYATASQLIGDHADTSGYHGYQLDSCNGLRSIAPFSFKSGNANVAAPGTYTDARNYSITNCADTVLVAPFSNQDDNCQYAYYGHGNTNVLLIAPVSRGSKPSDFDKGTKVVLAMGKMAKYNSLAVPEITNLTLDNATSGTVAVAEAEGYSRAFNAMMYRGEIIVRLGAQNRIMIGEFYIATGGNTNFPSTIPISWRLQGSSPDVSASITIAATFSTSGATLTVSNSTGESVAIGISIQQICSAKSV